MLDIGGWEFLLIAILGIMIIGPKELPGAIRTVSMFVRRARELARDFQSGIEEVAREAELDKLTDDIKEIAADGTGAGNLRDELQRAVDPDGTLAQAMDYETDWTDDDLIDYDDPEFADDNRISSPEQPNKADTAKSDTAKADTGDQNPEAAEGAGENVDGEPASTAVTENTAAGEPDVETTQPSPEAESGKKPDGAS
jgi:sec-independent protein translocase protein TatB